MWWVLWGTLALMLALCGCKATDKKSPDREPSAATASRDRNNARDKDTRGPTWLEEIKQNLPGGGGTVPKADSWADPRDPRLDVSREVRGVLGGVVIDPDGHRAGNVVIQIEPVEGSPSDQAPISIVADSQGYFLTKGLKAGQSYTLLVRAEFEGRPLIAVQQVRVPNPNLTIRLRDDLYVAPRPKGDGRGGDDAVGLPPPSPELVQGSRDARPNRNIDLPPPADLTPSNDGAWSPGSSSTGPLHRIVPSTVPNPSPTPSSVPGTRPTRPENITASPKSDWPPAASLPTPPLPALPPPVNLTPAPISSPAPTPPPLAPSRNPDPGSSSQLGPSLRLLDLLNRPWSFENRSGKLVLVDFMTTSCLPCKRSIPTLIAIQSRYGAYGLQVIAVACDEKPLAERMALANKYAREWNLNYALYVEPGQEPGSVRDRFRVDRYPTAILLDASGHEIWRGHPNDAARLEAAIRQHLSR